MIRRRRPVNSNEVNDARRRSRHLATFVVEEAKRGSTLLAKRLSLTRPQRRQSNASSLQRKSVSEPPIAYQIPSTLSSTALEQSTSGAPVISPTIRMDDVEDGGTVAGAYVRLCRLDYPFHCVYVYV